MISMIKYSNDPMKKITVPVFCSFQFHPIVRIDGTSQFMLDELCGHDLFSIILLWEDNVVKECPWRKILSSHITLAGSNDCNMYVLLNVGLYLESQFPIGVNGEGTLNCFLLGESVLSTRRRRYHEPRETSSN